MGGKWGRYYRRGKTGVRFPKYDSRETQGLTRHLVNNGRFPFDLTSNGDIFPKAGPVSDDSVLTAALLKRNSQLSPSTEEIQVTQNFATRVQGVLETLIITPGKFQSCQIEEVRLVGSFKQGTILIGHKSADFVVVLRSFPTYEAIDALKIKVTEELRQTECILSTVTKRGFELSNVQATVRICITTVPQNVGKLNQELHLDSALVYEHWQAIRHSRWFEENAHNSTIKVLIRILKDLRLRYPQFLPLSTWMLDILAHFSVLINPAREPLPINLAFRRSLSIMSSGLYLPGYSGTECKGHKLSYEQQDIVTAAAQTLLRILAHGGYNIILGLETDSTKSDLFTRPLMWDNGVVIQPVQQVYDSAIKMEDLDEDDNTDDEDEKKEKPITVIVDLT